MTNSESCKPNFKQILWMFLSKGCRSCPDQLGQVAGSFTKWNKEFKGVPRDTDEEAHPQDARWATLGGGEVGQVGKFKLSFCKCQHCCLLLDIINY